MTPRRPHVGTQHIVRLANLSRDEVAREWEAWAVERVREHANAYGMAWVPGFMLGLDRHCWPQAHLALIAAHGNGSIELRPDGGRGRFTKDQLESAPPGPDGSRLLWARLL